MTTYTALGDSITLGIGDPVRPVRPGGPRWRGWAVLLADSLDQPSLHILAASGGRAADVESTQLPRALQLRPDLASVVFGINDTLRPGFDPDGFAATAAHVVGALRAAGADVLTMRLPDPGRMLGLPGPLARPLAWRARQHPSERGHRLIARRFHALLAAAGHRLGPPPDAEPHNPPPSRLAEFGWLATKGTAWVVRRSTDLVPHLLATAIREWPAGPEGPAAAGTPSAEPAALAPSDG